VRPLLILLGEKMAEGEGVERKGGKRRKGEESRNLRNLFAAYARRPRGKEKAAGRKKEGRGGPFPRTGPKLISNPKIKPKVRKKKGKKKRGGLISN